MAEPEFIEITPKQFDLWEKFIEHSVQSSLFSTSEFYTALSEANFNPRIFAVQKGQYLHAGCLVSVQKKGPFTIAGPLPHVTYNGILVLDQDTDNRSKIESLYEESLGVLANGLQQRFDYVMLDQQPSFEDIRPLYRHSWQAQPRYTYHVDLTKSGGLESSFEKEARREINRARDEGVTVKTGGEPADVIEAYDASKKQLTDELATLIRTTATNLGERQEVYVARTADESIPPAAALIVRNQREAQYLFGAAPVDSRSSHVSAQLINELCRDLQDDVRRLDLTGGHAPRVGRFLRRFSSSLTRYDRTTYGTLLARIARWVSGNSSM